MSRFGRVRGSGRGWGRGRPPGERSAVRKAAIVAALPLALVAAVIAQLTVVNRLSLPGGDAPDLVLLLVTAVAVLASPLTGALAGFAGGLALDVAPPQAHYAGEYALVFCLTGYAAARASAAVREGPGDRSPHIFQVPRTELTVMAAAAAVGEAGKAAIGLLLSDPNVTGPAIRQVLPGAVLYDLLLAPVTLWLVSLVAGRAVPDVAQAPAFAPAGRLGAVFRLASAGAVPRLRLAGSGPNHQGPSWARRQPKLRLSGARARSVFGGTNRPASGLAQPLLAGGRASKLNFASHGRAGSLNGRAAPYASAPRPGKSPSKGWLRRDRATGRAPVRRKTPSRGWLRSTRTAALPGLGRRPVRRSPSRGWLRSSRRSLARPNRYASAPSGRWLRRSRHPWRRRGKRFLALVGGRR
jgi:rod shape-determining protein MreD